MTDFQCCYCKSGGGCGCPSCNGGTFTETCIQRGLPPNPPPFPVHADSRQPKPNGNGVDIATLVQQDIERRAQFGEKKYGQRLQPNNGRNALLDVYQEILDAAMYIRQRLTEEGVLGRDLPK